MSVSSILLICIGLVGLAGGGELLVRGSVGLARIVRLSPMVIGLTVVAFGTSAPEFAVTYRSVSAGNPGISVGNVVGSNICNILLVLGISASLVPLAASKRLVRFDVPVMVGASVATWLLALDGRLGRWDGFFLFLALVTYTLWKLKHGRSEMNAIRHRGESSPQTKERLFPSVLLHLFFVGSGLCLLVMGAKWMISGSVSIAEAFGVQELIIGLTVVAVGTSLPEIVTSLMAIRNNERDLAVGNIVGSNLFNLLCVLGLTASIAPGGVPVPEEAIKFDMLVMIAVALACLPIFFTGREISRAEGGLFLFYFVVYIVFLILEAKGSQHLRTLEWVMGVFVLPLTVLTLGVTVYKGMRNGGKP
jgi:cation:H+ antiporter